MKLRHVISIALGSALFVTVGCGRFGYISGERDVDASELVDMQADAGAVRVDMDTVDLATIDAHSDSDLGLVDFGVADANSDPDAGSADAGMDAELDFGIVEVDMDAPDLDVDAGMLPVDLGTPALVVDPTSGLITSELGGTATFNVHLSVAPSADVTFNISTTDAAEGTAAPLALTFNSSTWNLDQTVTVTGVDDGFADGNQTYEIIVNVGSTLDVEYASLAEARVGVTNLARATPGVLVTPTSGLATSESGATDTFTVVLTAEPTNDVTISLTSDTPIVGGASPGSVTFTRLNWSVPQTVTVTGADAGLDSDTGYWILTSAAASADIGYAGIDVADVSVTNANTICRPWMHVVGSSCQVVSTRLEATLADAGDLGGTSVAISADGTTIAIGSVGEASNAIGVDGDASDNSMPYSGAIYVFRRSGSVWSQEAYIKAFNPDANDLVGFTLALSADGNVLVTTAPNEQSNAVGIGGDPTNNSAGANGAAYVFRRTAGTWAQDAYIHAPYVGFSFGYSAEMSADGNVIAIADYLETVFVFRYVASAWTVDATIHPSSTGMFDQFGQKLALSADGNTLAAGVQLEDSAAVGVGGNEADNSATDSGAVYVFRYSGMAWSQQAYIKASNTDANDRFGAVTLSGDGNILAVGASAEASAAVVVNGNQLDNSVPFRGAAYVFAFSGGVWAQTTYLKTARPTGEFARDLHITPDGSALLISNGGVRVSVFRPLASSWTEAEIVDTPNAGGETLDISADGRVIVLAQRNDSSGRGAVYMIER